MRQGCRDQGQGRADPCIEGLSQYETIPTCVDQCQAGITHTQYSSGSRSRKRSSDTPGRMCTAPQTPRERAIAPRGYGAVGTCRPLLNGSIARRSAGATSAATRRRLPHPRYLETLRSQGEQSGAFSRTHESRPSTVSARVVHRTISGAAMIERADWSELPSRKARCRRAGSGPWVA